MPQVPLIAQKFAGLRPSINRMQTNEIGVIAGSNFRMSIDGPYSGWGNIEIDKSLPFDVFKYPHIATFNLHDQVVLCSSTGIYTRTNQGWVQVVANTPKLWDKCEDNDYPWTYAFVGDTWFFCHPTFGLAGYSKDTCSWHKACLIDSVGDKGKFLKFKDYQGPMISEPYYGITQSNNRLILLAYDTVSWSEIDNGFNFKDNMHSGTGFQSLSVNQFGRPLGVYESAKGFLVYTSNSIVAFSKRDDEAAFQVDQLSTSQIPLSPYVIAQLDNKIHVILSKSGLYTLDHNYPQEWEPIMGKWIVESLAKGYDFKLHRNHIRFFYSTDTSEFFISFSNIGPAINDGHNKIFSRSLVFNETLKNWASFNSLHRFIGNVNFISHRLDNNNLGFISTNGGIRWFDNGKYDGENPLNSFVQIGVFQLGNNQDQTMRSELFNFTLYTNPIDSLESDRINDSPFQDNETDLDQLGKVSGSFNVMIAGTDDGYSIRNGQWETPECTDATYFMQNYSCNLTGLGYILQISAKSNEQYYKLSRCDLNIVL
jgi:hypothetical protein